MDRTGIYGLFRLDSAPIDAREAATLGFELPGPPTAALARAVDLADPDAVHLSQSDDALTLLLGHLDDPAAVAARLGMAAETPRVTLADAALRRFGPDVRQVMAGEWTLLHRDAGRITLACSIAQRDPLLYAREGDRVAIGPDLRQLGRIDWIGDALDDVGVLFAVGRQGLRAAMAGRTALARVRMLEPGGFVTLDRAGSQVAPRAVPAPAPRWRGRFEDAVAETGALLNEIVRQRIGAPRIGCMVSGGLDSSTVAWLATRNRRPDTLLSFLTSAAPADSGLADETEFAQIVADHLGAPLTHVIPDEEPHLYRPSAVQLRERNGPLLGPRHYLYDAFAGHAQAHAIPLLLDGQYGEFTLTNPFPLSSWRDRLRRRLHATRRKESAEPGAAFHLFMAPHRLAALPDAVAAAVAASAPPGPPRMPAPGDLWGILAGTEKAMLAPASLALGRVRIALPFRDPRLLTLFSGFPAGMLQRPGQNRAPVRHLLTGHLPDSIRLRPKGLAFSPDYFERLTRQAPAARARIGTFRKAGADEWLDLDALDAALERIAGGAARGRQEILTAQLTAMAAEFIAWWRGVS